MRTLALVVSMAAFQAASPTVLRFGPLANQLSAQDMQSLRELAIRWGGEPWMMTTGTGMIIAPDGAAYWSAMIRLRAYSDSTVVRRGDQFVATTTRRGDALRQWTPSAAGSWAWAQVKLEDRAFDDVRGEDDINAPFATDLIVTDEELVGIVTFLRTDPIFKAERNLPVSSIARVYSDDDSWISLSLVKGRTCVDGYQLRPAHRGWTVTWRGGVCA